MYACANLKLDEVCRVLRKPLPAGKKIVSRLECHLHGNLTIYMWYSIKKYMSAINFAKIRKLVAETSCLQK